ncbi:MAG: NADH-quinone oxidoreductase subunit C [Pseudomonadota bacterium]
MGLSSSYLVTPDLQKLVVEELGAKVLGSGVHQGDFWIQVNGEDVLDVIDFLRSHERLAFDWFVDLFGVDYLGKASPRFEVVIHLYSMAKKHRIRLRCRVSDRSLTMPSVVSRWPAANWQEREAFDQYGIRFDGHPNLERILNAPDLTVFPQRKDYPLKGDRETEEDL